MIIGRRTLWFAVAAVCLLPAISGAAGPSDATFTEHEAKGLQAEKAGDLNGAMRHFAAACRTETRPVLTVMRHSYCVRTVEIAEQLGAFEEAQAWFDQDCSGGSDVGCYTLALLEEKRGHLGRAVDLMRSLCHKGFTWPPVQSLDACSEGRRLNELWITKDPAAAKRSAAWTLLLMALPVGGILALRNRALSLRLVRVAAWLVALPFAVLLLCQVSSWFLMLALLPLSFYFLPPALLFGKPHFMVEIGAGPTDTIGMLYAAGFYLLVACALALLVHGWKRARTASHGVAP